MDNLNMGNISKKKKDKLENSEERYNACLTFKSLGRDNKYILRVIRNVDRAIDIEINKEQYLKIKQMNEE